LYLKKNEFVRSIEDFELGFDDVCLNNVGTNNKKNLAVKIGIIASIAIFAFLICLVGYLFRRKKKRILKLGKYIMKIKLVVTL
jgi:hypothetical protein